MATELVFGGTSVFDAKGNLYADLRTVTTLMNIEDVVYRPGDYMAVHFTDGNVCAMSRGERHTTRYNFDEAEKRLSALLTILVGKIRQRLMNFEKMKKFPE